MCLPIFIRLFERRNKDEYQTEAFRKKWIDTSIIGRRIKSLEIWDQRDLSSFIEEVMSYLYKLTDRQLKQEFPEFHGAPEAILVGAVDYYFILKKEE